MIANSRAHAAHSRRIAAFWLITFLGALVQAGLCTLDVPPEVAVSEMLAHAPAGACWMAGTDRAEHASSARMCRVLQEGLGHRAVLAGHRTSGLRSIGVLPGSLLLAAWITGGYAGYRGARRWAEALRARVRPAGAHLLIRLCIART